MVFFENRRDERQEGFHHRQRMRRLLTGEVLFSEATMAAAIA